MQSIQLLCNLLQFRDLFDETVYHLSPIPKGWRFISHGRWTGLRSMRCFVIYCGHFHHVHSRLGGVFRVPSIVRVSRFVRNGFQTEKQVSWVRVFSVFETIQLCSMCWANQTPTLAIDSSSISVLNICKMLPYISSMKRGNSSVFMFARNTLTLRT